MRSRYAWLTVLAVVLCLVMPGAAFAKKGSVQVNSVSGHYKVAKGANLKIVGRLRGAPQAADWSVHAPVVLQRKVKGVWKNLVVLRMDSRGNFTFRLTKPHAGDYRVLYPGCSHYNAGSKCFDICGGTCSTKVAATVKLPALLSIPRAAVIYAPDALSAEQRRVLTDRIDLQAIVFNVVTGQSPEAMTGFNLTYRVLASVSGDNYVPIYTFPSPLTFTNGGILLSQIVPRHDSSSPPNYYRSYKVEVSWGGNGFTAPGSASAIVNGDR